MLLEEKQTNRNTYIGGSDVGAICGVGFKTRFDLWMEKTGQVESKFEANTRMQIGILLEDYVLSDYEASSNCKVTRRQEFKQVGFAGGTIDGLDEARGVLVDAKVNFKNNFENDELPLQYLCQAHWYMKLFDLKVADFHVLHIVNANFRTYRVNFDSDFFKDIYEECERFWWYVQEKTPPPPANGESFGAHVKAREARAADRKAKAERFVNNNQIEALKEVAFLKKQVKVLEERKDQLLLSVAASELIEPGVEKLLDFDTGEIVAKVVRKKESGEFLRLDVK